MGKSETGMRRYLNMGRRLGRRRVKKKRRHFGSKTEGHACRMVKWTFRMREADSFI
jgi:hypothetical protein